MASKKKLKVYGWRDFRGRHQVRVITAAPSMAAVARIVGAKNPQTLDMCETGNDEELKLAMSEPGVLFWHSQPNDQI